MYEDLMIVGGVCHECGFPKSECECTGTQDDHIPAPVVDAIRKKVSDMDNAANTMAGIFTLTQRIAELEGENKRLLEINANLSKEGEFVVKSSTMRALRADRERLEWLMKRVNEGNPGMPEDQLLNRERIDIARKAGEERHG